MGQTWDWCQSFLPGTWQESKSIIFFQTQHTHDPQNIEAQTSEATSDVACLCVWLWVTEKSCTVRTALLWNITQPAFNKIAVQSHCLCGHINRDAWYKTCTAAVGRTSDTYIFVRCCCRIITHRYSYRYAFRFMICIQTTAKCDF